MRQIFALSDMHWQSFAFVCQTVGMACTADLKSPWKIDLETGFQWSLHSICRRAAEISCTPSLTCPNCAVIERIYVSPDHATLWCDEWSGSLTCGVSTGISDPHLHSKRAKKTCCVLGKLVPSSKLTRKTHSCRVPRFQKNCRIKSEIVVFMLE